MLQNTYKPNLTPFRGGAAKYYLALCLMLMLTLGKSWGQSGGNQPEEPPLIECTEQQNFPYNVTYSLDTLPCVQSVNAYKLKIKVGPSNVGSTFSIVDPLNQAVITNTSVTGNGEYIFEVEFTTKGGWRQLEIIPQAPCHRIKTIEVPVLCNCEVGSYKVLGWPNANITVSSTTLSAHSVFYVIGDITITTPANYSFYNKYFQVLGKSNYHTNQPGGNIIGPYISLSSLSTPGSNLYIGDINQVQNTFKGDACFGMWGGINFTSSQNGGGYVFSNNEIKDAKIGIDNSTGIVKDLYINNSKVKACLNGVNTPAEYLKHFYLNEISSEPMLKPFDYELVQGNHNYELDQVNGLYNKTFTRFGLYLSGERTTPRMVGSNWQNNLFKECIIGQYFQGGINSQFDSDSNNYERNLFSGLYLNHSPLGEIIHGNFSIYAESDIAYQLIAEKAIRRKPDNYGIFVVSQDSAFVNVRKSTFEALTSNAVGIYYGNEIGKVTNNIFQDKFKAAVSFRRFLTGSEIRENRFMNNRISILTDSGSNATFTLHCNTFELYSGTAMLFGAGSATRFSEICQNATPCGNKFLQDGIIIENHPSNPSIDYWRYDNEINNSSIQSFRNAGFRSTTAWGVNGVECPLVSMIFTRLLPNGLPDMEPKEKGNGQVLKCTLSDLSGRVLFEEFEYKRDIGKLQPGVYLLREGNKLNLLRK